MSRLKASLDHKRIRRLVWLVLTVFVLLGYSLQGVAGSVYYSLVMQAYGTVGSPPVFLEEGNVSGASTIYANKTSAKVSVAAPVWLSGWEKRVRITIDNNDVDGALSNFPVLVYLSNSSGRNNDDVSFVFDELQSDANRKKIAVTTSDGTTQCYVEIEKWDDASEQAWLWLKVPSVSSTNDTHLYLYYDAEHVNNTGYVGDPNSTQAENVWDTNFKGVWHMTEVNATDSTSNSNDGTESGGVTYTDSGKIDGADDFDGNDDYIQTTSNELKTLDNFTLSVWFKADSTTAPQHILWEGPASQNGWGDGSGNPNTHEMHLTICKFDANNTLNFFYGYEESGGVWAPAVEINMSFSDTTNWNHAVVVMTGAGTSPSAELFLNGVSQGTDTGTQTNRTAWDTNLRIGRPGANQRYFDGMIDEVRILETARSAGWIKASYESGRDHLLDFGPEDYVDNNTSDVDSSPDKGTHSNFTTQKYFDGIYDNLTEVDKIAPDNNNVDSEIVTHGSTTGISGAQTLDGITENMTEGIGGAPTYQEFTEEKATSGSSVTVSKPAGTSTGDLLLCVYVTDGSHTHTAPDGSYPWTEIDQGVARPFDERATVSIWWRIAVDGEPSSYQFGCGASEHHYIFIIRITGHNSSNPINAWDVATGENSSPQCPDITTSKDDCLILRITGQDDDDITINGGYPSGHTGITMDESGASAYSCSGGAAYKTQASAGSTGTASFSLTASEEWRAYTVAIAPGVNYQLDIEHVVNSIGNYKNYKLTTRAYRTASENFYVQLYDFTSSQWVTMSTITGSSLTWYNTTFAKADFINSSNQARIRYWQGVDATEETLYVDYCGVYGWNETTNITFDAQTGTIASGASASWSHTIGTGSNRLFVVGVTFEHNDAPYPSVSDVQYNSVSLTKIAERDSSASSYNSHASLWYMLNPPSGTHNIDVTVSADPYRDIICYGISYAGVKQSAPDDYDTNAISPGGGPADIPVTLTAAAGGSVAVFTINCGNEGTYTALAECTIRDQDAPTGETETGCIGDAMDISFGDKEVGASHNDVIRASIVAAIWQPASGYDLDLEVQWTSTDYTNTNEELCIKTGTTDTEDIKVDVWNGSEWITLITDLNATTWNNASVSSYLTSSTFTIRFKGGNETDDTNPDSWNIDATLLHVWTPDTYNYVLKVVNQVDENWTVNLQVYDSSNIGRLSSLNISLHDGTSSNQIAISGGNITQSEGPQYNLAGNATIYISMSNLQATTTDTSYLYVHLKIRVPDTSTYMLYVINFEIT